LSVDTDNQRRATAIQEAKEKEDAHKAFISSWHKAVDDVVAPALQEVADTLKQKGWVARVNRISISHQPRAVRLYIYRGNMTGGETSAGDERTRPHIEFKPDPMTDRVSVYEVTTTNRDGPGSLHTVEDLTFDSVQRIAVEYFQRLVSA
jgi:hypothetical protein